MNLAVVRNTTREGVIARFGKPCPERYGKRTVRRVVDALVDAGHSVAVLEGDKTLLAELERSGAGLVVNMAYGIQGESRYTHIPAMLELAGVPYTGAAPLGHSVSLDKVIAKTLMQAAGVPTPAFAVLAAAGRPRGDLRFPVVVKPRHESTSYGLRLARDRAQLDAAVDAVVRGYEQEALVEEYVEGREVCVGLLGNDPPDVLPPVELSFAGRSLRVMTVDDKYHRRVDEPEKLCPAPLSPSLLETLADLARATFAACHARDYARVDIRIDTHGQPYVLELNSMASLGGGGSFVRAAEVAGYGFAELVRRIVDVAHLRCFGVCAPLERTPALAAT